MADIPAGAGTIDSFPGSSIWPFVLGMGATFTVLTFVFGLWMAPIAGALILSAAIGGTMESRRGGTV
jgi:lipopolysaccharide export LptBFGC system permease protein LptF